MCVLVETILQREILLRWGCLEHDVDIEQRDAMQGTKKGLSLDTGDDLAFKIGVTAQGCRASKLVREDGTKEVLF